MNGDGRPDFVFTVGDVPLENGSEPKIRVYVIYGVGSSTFVRGDSNSDGEVNIADGVFTLAHLFAGGEAPLCEDAADTDDDGGILITDAIYLFEYLFGGGPAPPPPFAEAGEDPTEDELTCGQP